MFKRFFKDYFTFTRSERNGLIILLSLLFLLLIARAATFFPGSEKAAGLEEFENDLALFENSLQSLEEVEISGAEGSLSEPFLFDPNSANEADLLALGLDRFVTANIIKYRKKGGIFSSAQDLKKIYGLKDQDYLNLEPFIQIDPGLVGAEKPEQNLQDEDGSVAGDSLNYFTRDRSVSVGSQRMQVIPSGPGGFSISLNQADSLQLIKLPGIGPVFSGRIIRYRELLGGYYCKEQLLEVYRFTPEMFERISGMVRIDTQNIDLIDVNHIMLDSLPYHPYLTEYQFRAIIKFRDLNGSFVRIGEILENRLLPPGVYRKVQPYLTVWKGKEDTRY